MPNRQKRDQTSGSLLVVGCHIFIINERNTAFEMAEEADMTKEVEMEMERVATRLNSKDIDLLMTSIVVVVTS